MTKTEFLECLRRKISAFPLQEAEECISFYGEMIDDRMEEGLDEESAVLAVGSVEEIVAQMSVSAPREKYGQSRQKAQSRSLRVWEIVLLALGSPIWLALVASAAAVILSLYVCLWAVLVSCWAVFASLVGSAFGMLVMGIGLAAVGNAAVGGAAIGIALVCVGLSVFAFFGCRAASRGVLWLSYKPIACLKQRWNKKEGEG